MAHYSKRFRFNAHDAGSVASNVVMASASYLAAAGVLDTFAEHGQEQLTMDDGLAAWVVQATFFLVIKVIATTLRSGGDSPSRRLASNLFNAIVKGIKSGILSESKK